MSQSPQPPLWRSALEQTRLLARGISTPSHAATPFTTAAGRTRRLPYVLMFLAVAVLLPVGGFVLSNAYGMNGVVAGSLATVQTAPLLLALTRPLQAWWIIGSADVVGALALLASPAAEKESVTWPWPVATVLGYVLLMVCLGLRESRHTLLGVWFLTALVGFLFELIPQTWSDGTHVLVIVVAGVVLLVTGALRERGEAQRRLVAQETISEQERTRRTLLEERTRIARELHDVVAHHMSVITVQADSAPYRVRGLPPAAGEEFAAIAAGARESLTEMRRLLAVLRSEDTGGELAPQPGLSRLQQLVEATVRAGVPVSLAPGAAVKGVPPAVDLSAYRIVQEALSNVVRHAPGAAARVSVTSDGTDLVVLVVNEAAAAPHPPLETAAGTGHGLVGMRERVRLTGGTLDTGPLPDGGFRVAARLPLGTPVPAEDDRP
ncbi:sensor histidine kinase [Streptomyces yaizuensis]|uniref:histidine kinase n=1 Tax=Streptomyces yaizuensis TaxID=2989713 RepID=A0ABQ5NU25_9ACTN|nr:sensor histidine kinase [Streptomyces sp. YSPA8]GLF93868.1 sensor histidine kinase [Streptomyces sp. YSPA8]